MIGRNGNDVDSDMIILTFLYSNRLFHLSLYYVMIFLIIQFI
jgi:hypothetical protein